MYFCFEIDTFLVTLEKYTMICVFEEHLNKNKSYYINYVTENGYLNT